MSTINIADAYVPEGNVLTAGPYYAYNGDTGIFEVTLYYRPKDGGPKRRIDLEFELFRKGDHLATEAVDFN